MTAYLLSTLFRSGRISSVYIVGCWLWVGCCHTFSKLANFECVGMLVCWCAVVLECVGVLECWCLWCLGCLGDWKSVRLEECKSGRV